MGDRIDRATLLQFISEALGENAYCDNALYKYVLQGAKNLPAADVIERKIGKWITDIDDCHYCSECGNPAEINYITGECMNSPYCSQCGADMR